MMKALCIAQTRPNCIKLAPLAAALTREHIEHLFVLAPNPEDTQVCDSFSGELDIPSPVQKLDILENGPVRYIGSLMAHLDGILSEYKPDIVIVTGDADASLAAALTAAKKGIQVAHIEAGLRSMDPTQPEELNRITIDHCSMYLFTHSPTADDNLRREGIPEERIFRVGNILIDAIHNAPVQETPPSLNGDLNLEGERYALATVHRAFNIDSEPVMKGILDAFCTLQKDIPIVFPVHPATRAKLEGFGMWERLVSHPRIHALPPVAYTLFQGLLRNATFVITDSGCIQEEATYYDVPCLTLREHTERPITISMGTNELIGRNAARIVQKSREVLLGQWKHRKVPEMWDGNTANRIVDLLVQALG